MNPAQHKSQYHGNWLKGLTFEKSACPLEKKQEEEEAYEAVRVQREKYAQQVCRTSSGTGVLAA